MSTSRTPRRPLMIAAATAALGAAVAFTSPAAAEPGVLAGPAPSAPAAAAVGTPVGGALTPVGILGSAGQEHGAAADRGDRRAVPRVAREWAAAWNSGDGQRMAALFTEDGVYEDFAFERRYQGREAIASWVSLTLQVIPDTRIEVTDAFRSGDRVAVEFVFSGTPGELVPGVPATGRSFSVPGVSVFELRGGRLAQVSDYYNVDTLYRQIGLTPPPPAG